MSGALIVGIVIAVAALIAVAKAVVIVPRERAATVERFGRYARTLRPGVHVLVPFVDAVRHRHTLAEETHDVRGEACRTRDDRQVWIDARITIRVEDPERASYAVDDYRLALPTLTRTTLRRTLAAWDLDRMLADVTALGAAVGADISKAVESWGLAVPRLEITDISRHPKESHP